MGLFDIILIIILFFFVFYGLSYGLIRAVGSIAGLLAGFWTANAFYLPVFGWLKNLFFGFDNVGRIITFLLIFAIVNRLVCFGFVVLDRSLDILSVIPFLKTINRLAGALFGLAFGGLAIGLVLYGITKQPVFYSLFKNQMDHSRVAPNLLKFTESLIPFLPMIIKKIQTWIAGFDFWKKISWKEFNAAKILQYKEKIVKALSALKRHLEP